MLESNHQDKGYPSRNNIAIVDSLLEKVGFFTFEESQGETGISPQNKP